MAHLTTLDELSQHINLLACVEESEAPFISAYLNLENGLAEAMETIHERAIVLRKILKANDLDDFEEALGKIQHWLRTELLAESKGVAIFIRGTHGGSFMLPMQFAAPLPNWIAVYPTPNIYHLVEIKDNYHRYVVLLARSDHASIFEVNLGAATIQAWLKNPALRKRVGQGWSRTHFQIHQSHRGSRFIQAKIQVLEQLMSSGGHTHLIMAGDTELTAGVLAALPDDLSGKLVEIIPAEDQQHQDDVVLDTLASFIKHEELESRSIAEQLIEGLRNENLAVAGSAKTLDALRWGEVDTLVMASDYHPDPGWSCTACRACGTELPVNKQCQQCGRATVRPMDVREVLLRLAGQFERPVEIVEHAEELMSLGGVGCLLRIQPTTQFEQPEQLSVVNG